MDEQGKERPTKFRNVRINWGRGRLARFSSTASFIAQFCALNDLKLEAFERFIAEYFDCDKWYQSLFSPENLSPLADLLDEPFSIIKSVGSNCFYLPVCFGEFDLHAGSEVKRYISYCPKCISNGFHSAFHESCWLYRCPVHGELIKGVLIDSGHGAYVKKLTELLHGACARWPNVWGAEVESQGSLRLDQLRLWLESAHDQVTQLRIQNVASTGDAPYAFEHIGTILGRLDGIAPIPPELVDLFVAPPIRQQQIRVEVALDAASRIKSIDSKFPLWNLLWFYNKHAIAISRCLSSRRLAIREIERLQVEHPSCRCHWTWDRYSGWMQIDPGEKYINELLCPYEYAIRELKERWIDFASIDATPQAVSKIESQFLIGCGIVLDNEFGYIPDPPIDLPNLRGLSHYLLLPKLTLENDVEFILESLLASQARAHCEQLSTWLSSITSEHIPHRTTMPGNTNLFRSENTAWVSTWNSLETQSIDPVARWSEGRQIYQK